MTDGERLECYGVALYGASWKSPIAHHLKIARSYVSAVLKGERKLNPKYWDLIKNLHHVRMKEIQDSLDTINNLTKEKLNND